MSTNIAAGVPGCLWSSFLPWSGECQHFQLFRGVLFVIARVVSAENCHRTCHVAGEVSIIFVFIARHQKMAEEYPIAPRREEGRAQTD